MLLLFYKFFAIIYIENKERGVKAMRTYHPASWSQRAREMANVQFRQVIYYTYIHPEKWTLERTPEETAIELFNFTIFAELACANVINWKNDFNALFFRFIKKLF